MHCYSYSSDLCSRKNQVHRKSKNRLECLARSIHILKLPSQSSVKWLSLETENWNPTQRMGQWGEGNCFLDSNRFASKSCLRWNADRFTLSLPTSNDSPLQNFLTGYGLRDGMNGLAVNEDVRYTWSIKCFEWQCIWVTQEGESFSVLIDGPLAFTFPCGFISILLSHRPLHSINVWESWREQIAKKLCLCRYNRLSFLWSRVEGRDY